MVHEIDRAKALKCFALFRKMSDMDKLSDEYTDVFDECWDVLTDAIGKDWPGKLVNFLGIVVEYNPDVTDDLLFSLLTDVLGIVVK